ncbi:unnamed protein product, partial [Mesorhabditis belari]|uniref:Uncharacterized protein n=1 Tax=Mesorhabditis belari TaxID=2138241 RepID=A0AAF3EV68_9BILA
MEAVSNVYNYFLSLPMVFKILIISLIVADIAFSSLYGIVGKYKKLYKVLFPKKKQHKKTSGRTSYKAGKAN